MQNLLNQLDFDILAVEYLVRIDAKLNPENSQTVRNYFNNDSDSLLDAILSIDETRKAKGNVIIEQFRRKRPCTKKKCLSA